MLRIGKMTDYALLIIGRLAKSPHAMLSATMLAEELHLNVPTVSKILKTLSESKLVHAMRGAEGGYQLSRLPQQITVAEVVAAMEGRLAITECCEKAGLCTIDAFCTLKENWKKINGMIHDLLAQWTILDLLTPSSQALRHVEELGLCHPEQGRRAQDDKHPASAGITVAK